MYKNLGYIVYRTILEYYSGDQDEDAYGEFIVYSMNISPDQNYNQTICYPSTFYFVDMRKALSRDVFNKSVIPYTQPVRLEDIDMNWYQPNTARIRIYV